MVKVVGGPAREPPKIAEIDRHAPCHLKGQDVGLKSGRTP
jgi:hypothetical protein